MKLQANINGKKTPLTLVIKDGRVALCLSSPYSQLWNITLHCKLSDAERARIETAIKAAATQKYHDLNEAKEAMRITVKRHIIRDKRHFKHFTGNMIDVARIALILQRYDPNKTIDENRVALQYIWPVSVVTFRKYICPLVSGDMYTLLAWRSHPEVLTALYDGEGDEPDDDPEPEPKERNWMTFEDFQRIEYQREYEQKAKQKPKQK